VRACVCVCVCVCLCVYAATSSGGLHHDRMPITIARRIYLHVSHFYCQFVLSEVPVVVSAWERAIRCADGTHGRRESAADVCCVVCEGMCHVCAACGLHRGTRQFNEEGAWMAALVHSCNGRKKNQKGSSVHLLGSSVHPSPVCWWMLWVVVCLECGCLFVTCVCLCRSRIVWVALGGRSPFSFSFNFSILPHACGRR